MTERLRVDFPPLTFSSLRPIHHANPTKIVQTSICPIILDGKPLEDLWAGTRPGASIEEYIICDANNLLNMKTKSISFSPKNDEAEIEKILARVPLKVKNELRNIAIDGYVGSLTNNDLIKQSTAHILSIGARALTKIETG